MLLSLIFKQFQINNGAESDSMPISDVDSEVTIGCWYISYNSSLNNTALNSTHNHQDQINVGRDDSSRGPPDQRYRHLWDHPWLPSNSLESGTGRQNDNQMQRCCPNRTCQSECETISDNLNLIARLWK